MSPRAEYFHRRRRRLRRQHRCTRCGTEPAKRAFTLCAGCLAVAAMKRAQLPTEAEQRAKDEKRKRLLKRLDLIDEARRAVQDELDRT